MSDAAKSTDDTIKPQDSHATSEGAGTPEETVTTKGDSHATGGDTEIKPQDSHATGEEV